MGDLINLRKARKRAERETQAHRAEENRLRYGRTKAERLADKAATEKAARSLEGHRLKGGEGE